MKKIFRLVLVFSFPLAVLLLSNCKKEQFGNGNLTFSTDTLTFDTVFTSLGSTTRYFKVFNRDNKAVKISDIRLKRLVGAQFRIDVDGLRGDHVTDVEIPAKDSIYVFVEVTVDPNNAATPFVIIDDVSIIVNGSESIVHLQAFGQNAHFHYGEEISTNKVWNNDLPHVIVGGGAIVKCGAELRINPGCKIFFAGNSAIYVEGSLRAEATNWQDSIVFEGARLEEFYHDKPGQWLGIVFLRDSSTGACAPTGIFDHCIVNESTYGIYAGAGRSTNLNTYLGSTGRPDITIKNSIVKNSQDNSVYGFNAKITATNCIFHTAGEHLLKLALGGDYKFTHCTMVNNGSRFVSHEKEALLLSNFVYDGVSTTYAEPLKTTFTNCVLFGSLKNEISFNNIFEDTVDTRFDNTFIYSDVKTNQDTFNMFTLIHDNILFNEEPKFVKPDEGNYTPDDSTGYFSPLIDASPFANLSQDIFGAIRPVSKTSNTNKFDMGAVEAQ